MFGDTMYSLNNNPILYPHQITLLSLFFALPFGRQFFFTGGSALAAFYLVHRESQDLDFFSLDPFDALVLRAAMQEIANTTQSNMTNHKLTMKFFLKTKKKLGDKRLI